MKLKVVFYSLAAILLFSCARKVTVSTITNQSDLKESFFYALPRNTLEFEVKVRSTTIERSNQAAWSDDCINYLVDKYDLELAEIKKIQNQPLSTSYAIEKDGISLAEGSKPDARKIYALNVKPKFFLDNAIGLTFNQDYILTEGLVSSENKSFEIGLTTVSSILSAVTGLRGAPAVVNPCPGSAFDELDAAINEYLTYIKLPTLPTGEAYQTAKNHYEKVVQQKFERALYKKSEKVYIIKFAVDLANDMANGSLQIFRLNASSGLLEINDALSARVKTSTSDKVAFVVVGGTDWYSINTQKQGDDVFTVVNAHNVASNSETGFIYNIPGTATFTLSKPNGATVLSNTYKIAQFGTTGSLNPKFSKASITLDPITGSLTKASGESKSIAISNISGTGDLFGKAKETFRKTTEEEELEKRAKLLELKAKIKELEEKQ